MATSARASEDDHVETKDYAGPCRRTSTSPEAREAFVVNRRLRIDMMNRAGKWALGVVAACVIWFASQVASSMRETQELRVAMASLAKAQENDVAERRALVEKVDLLVQRQFGTDAKLVLEMQRVTSEITALRVEMQAQTVRGDR